MARIEGVITAMVTPFTTEGDLDLDGARRLARHLIDNGSHGVVVAGTTGEAPTLTDEERLHLLAAVRDEIGDRATVIAGVGTNDTRHSVEQARDACLLEPDALLVTTPYYNKPNQAGLRAHFKSIAHVAGEIPIIVYNIPSRVVINMPPEFLADLGSTIPSVVAVKQANDDDIGPVDGLDVLAGNDNVFARCMAMGGAGGILVASHIVGAEMRQIYESAVSGDAEHARTLDAGLEAVYAALNIAPNPIPVKAALEMLGLIDGGLRLPMVPASQSERTAIRTALERHGLMLAGGAAK
jgi:4-hydroxy-tetrahydrodipicolinate synthase